MKKNAWDFGARALYFQPVYDAMGNYQATLDTGVSNQNGGGGGQPAYLNTTTYPEFNPSWGWGFMVEGGVSFC